MTEPPFCNPGIVFLREQKPFRPDKIVVFKWPWSLGDVLGETIAQPDPLSTLRHPEAMPRRLGRVRKVRVNYGLPRGALNSAVECHLHTVEVAGSNPAAPTNKHRRMSGFQGRLRGMPGAMRRPRQDCAGRVSGPSGAAAILGMPGSILEAKIKSLKIDKNRFKPPYLSTTSN